MDAVAAEFDITCPLIQRTGFLGTGSEPIEARYRIGLASSPKGAASRLRDREAEKPPGLIRLSQSIRRSPGRNPLFDVHQPPCDGSLRQFQRRRETLIRDQFVNGGTCQSRHLHDVGKAHQRFGMNFVHDGILGIGSGYGRRALQRPGIFRHVALERAAELANGDRLVQRLWANDFDGLPAPVGRRRRQDRRIVPPYSHRRIDVRVSLNVHASLASVRRLAALHRFGASAARRILISRRVRPALRLGARKVMYAYRLDA